MSMFKDILKHMPDPVEEDITVFGSFGQWQHALCCRVTEVIAVKQKVRSSAELACGPPFVSPDHAGRIRPAARIAVFYIAIVCHVLR